MENGIYAASITPLRPDFSCDTPALGKHCRSLIRRGCKGIAVFGTTGEGPSFSVAEKIEVLNDLRDDLDPKVTLIGNGAAGIRDTIDLLCKSASETYLGYLVSPPSFFKNISEEGTIAFYRTIINESYRPGLKIILYHIPQYSGVPITPRVVKTLSEEFPKVIIGIKESEGNLPLLKEFSATTPECKVFVGKETLVVEGKRLGASGGICGIANLCPETLVRAYETSEDLSSTFPKLGNVPFIAGIKALLGPTVCSPLVRPPLMPL